MLTKITLNLVYKLHNYHFFITKAVVGVMGL